MKKLDYIELYKAREQAKDDDRWHLWRIRIKFVPRDLWIGLFIAEDLTMTTAYDKTTLKKLYVCLIPMFPIIICFTKSKT